MSAYIEIVILDNLLIDYLILWATGLFFIPPPTRLRVWTAAAVGTVYAVVAPMRGFVFLLHPLIKVSVSLIMVLVAFGCKSRKIYLKQLSVFWLLSLASGGLIGGLGNLLGSASAVNGVMAVSGPPLWALLMLAFAAAKVYEHFFHSFRRRSAAANGAAKLEFLFAGKRLALDGFFDTGNSVCDPLSGMPAIIVSKSSVEQQLGSALDNDFLDANNCTLLIPFSDLSGGGVLRGCIPGSVCISSHYMDSSIEVRAAVAFTDKVSGFDALIPPSLAIAFGEEKHAVKYY